MKKNGMGEEWCICGVEGRFIRGLVGKAERNRSLGRPRRRGTYNTKIDPKIRMG